jgi:polysaccharide biosynthesis/export protein
MHRRFYLIVSLLFIVAAFVYAQGPVKISGTASATNQADHKLTDTNQTDAKPFVMPAAKGEPSTQTTGAATTAAPSNYTLGSADQVSFLVADLPEEFNDKTFRIDLAGDLNLPIVGRIHAAGLTIDQLEAQVASRLKRVVKNPDVVISIATFGSQSVSVLGAVGAPGPHQLEGRKNLSEILSLAGGLRTDAGATIKITRNMQWGRIPLADAVVDPTGNFNVASVKVKTIMDASHPAENIAIMPGDIVSVPVAEKVFAIGAITKPGGYLLDQHDSISALQIISLSQGLSRAAAPNRAKILRVVPGSPNRAEIAVDLRDILKGKSADVALQSDDILFVPSSKAKTAAYRSIDVMVLAATSTAVLGRF